MLICGVIPSQVQGFLFLFVDVNEFAAYTFFQPVQLLYGSTALQSISHLPWFCMGCELAEAALSPSSRSLKKTLSSPDPWGKARVTGPQLGLEAQCFIWLSGHSIVHLSRLFSPLFVPEDV